MNTKDKEGRLRKFSSDEFLKNSLEFKGYMINRRTQGKLNPDKLVNLLYVYFRSVLLYPSAEIRKYYANSQDGKLYVVEFSGTDETGKRNSVSLGEMSNTLIADVCSDLLKSAKINHLINLVDLFTRALVTPELDKIHKVNILNAENTILNQKFSHAIGTMPEKAAKEALNIRRSLVYSELKVLEQTEGQPDSATLQNIESLRNIIIKYTQCNIDLLIANNRFIDILQLIYKELEEHKHKEIRTALLNNLVTYNNLFLLERKETVQEKIEKFRSTIAQEEYDQLQMMLSFSPDKIEVKDFSVEVVEPDKTNIKFRNVDYQKIRTLISFVIPYKTRKDYVKFEYPDYIIEFQKLRCLFDDPIFLFLNDLQQNINGMPATIFSDAVGNLDHSTVVHVMMQEFFHPDFNLIDDTITYLDFEEEEAKLGRKYYPHKDRIIEIFRKLYKEHASQFPFDINRKDININLISNYFVSYIDVYGDTVFHKIHTITNLDSYLKVKSRYLETIGKLNLSDEFLSMRELLFETDILTASSLRGFANRALDLTVKKSIELRGIYKFLWKHKGPPEPLNESDIQPIIKTHLQPILEAKGIQISREVVSANGSLDFLCAYTRNGNLLKVGIELKKAHHQKLLHGLTHQLPQYLKDEGTKQGIFLVLWFKNDDFPQPQQYDSIDALVSLLKANIPQKYQFDIMVIDCTEHLSPSKM